MVRESGALGGDGEPCARVKRMRAADGRTARSQNPDMHSPAFVAEVRRQCLALKGSPAEAEALIFAEEAAGLVEGWA
mgnify:FL=1